MRLGPARRIPGPVLGQIEGPVNQGAAMRAGVAEKHTDLAVLDPPRRARVLPLYPRRLLSLFQEAGLVQHQHSTGVAQVLHYIGLQVIAHRVRIQCIRARKS